MCGVGEEFTAETAENAEKASEINAVVLLRGL